MKKEFNIDNVEYWSKGQITFLYPVRMLYYGEGEQYYARNEGSREFNHSEIKELEKHLNAIFKMGYYPDIYMGRGGFLIKSYLMEDMNE